VDEDYVFKVEGDLTPVQASTIAVGALVRLLFVRGRQT
jgi:hypothetical protein